MKKYWSSKETIKLEKDYGATAAHENWNFVEIIIDISENVILKIQNSQILGAVLTLMGWFLLPKCQPG